MSESSPPTLISLASRPTFNSASRFAAAVAALDSEELGIAYENLMQDAPRRHPRGRQYFVGHNGIPSTGAYTNRIEEHLAIALWHDARTWQVPGGRSIELLDYQVPLKARRADSGVGKVDLLAIDSAGRLVVIELKILGKNGADTPLRALLEALSYAAIIEANLQEIRTEVATLSGRNVAEVRPGLMIAAPSDYWEMWDQRAAAAGWRQAFGSLCTNLSQRLECTISLVDIDNPNLELGLQGTAPRITTEPRFTERARWQEPIAG